MRSVVMWYIYIYTWRVRVVMVGAVQANQREACDTVAFCKIFFLLLLLLLLCGLFSLYLAHRLSFSDRGIMV